MGQTGKSTKSEWILLGITAVFLCLSLVLFWKDRSAVELGLTVQTEVQVPEEALAPDLSPININTADIEELDQLPGIGEVLAGRIIAYREEHGPFTSMEGLLEVSGIGEAKLAELEGWITIEDLPEGSDETTKE